MDRVQTLKRNHSAMSTLHYKIASRHHWLHYLVTGIVLITDVFTLGAMAYDGQVEANLKRSRDALHTQKTELENATHRIDTQILELRKQRDELQSYLQDTERALRNVELALKVTGQ